MIKPSTICFSILIILFPSASVQHQSVRVISGKGAFIFGPSLDEADTLDSDESEALNDFAQYSNKIASFVREKGIKCEYISARQIKVQYATVKIFTVNRDSIEFGTILTDGIKDPLLLKYVSTDIDLEEKCREYFHIK